MKYIIFHHNDADGISSAAIVYIALTTDQRLYEDKLTDNFSFYEMTYDKRVPVEDIKENDQIYIVDFSFDEETMNKILKIPNVNITWIDHHKTAFDKKYKEKVNAILDSNHAACKLTWDYFYPKQEEPTAIKLIEDHDIWNLKYSTSEPFITGLALHDISPESFLWRKLFFSNDSLKRPWKMKRLIHDGRICLEYRDKISEKYCRDYGFECKFTVDNIKYNCFACSFHAFGSRLFGSRIKEYDICISFAYIGDKYMVSLYTENPNINVGKIAKKFGGGGHNQAAGFVTPLSHIIVK